ncbi:MAG: exosortase/archaeosortase family protein [Deltaproteobacteria bacterium]|nr:exosortase/archaeosortase family protein [Deltaproteobacteria bacterium]
MKSIRGMVKLKHENAIYYIPMVIFLVILLYYPFFRWLLISWLNNPADTFGYLAPFVSAWAIYLRRREINGIEISSAKSGWILFLSGLLLVLLYRIYDQTVFASVSLPLFLYGVTLIYWGRKRSRYMLFPFLFLVFLYPWGDILNTLIGFKLRQFSVYISCLIFICMGMDAAISGTLLYTGRFLVDIAPACSGLTMMNVLLFMGAIGAYLYNGKKSKGIIIFLSVIPLSLIMNTIRIFFTGLTGHFFGEKTALNFYHDISGMFIFGLALLFLYWEASFFNRVDQKK